VTAREVSSERGLHLQWLIASVRLTVATLLVCVAGYTALILGVAQLLVPDSAQGSLITRPDGTVIGSRLIAQKFTQPRYFWPRPSAVDYNGSGAGGSNKSPTSADLTKRAEETIAQYGASADKPLPPELAAASGGGLDPHITERGALYQAPRVASARGIPEQRVEALIAEHAFATGGFLSSERLVNVLLLNHALDAPSAR
jgi:K+-transporting ATPase ATPase C chain